MYVKQCKVCNSKHRAIIEELAIKGFSPQKIYEHLQSMIDAKDRRIVKEEDVKPSAIRRHIQNHFDEKDTKVIQQATAKSKVQVTREKFNRGVQISIDKANTLSHLIELALANIEEVEGLSDVKKHQYTIQYMGQIKALIDELDKVSSQLDTQGGNIDANFYRTQMDVFAKIVLSTIRQLDIQFNMNWNLEIAFSEEFKKQYKLFKEKENMVFAGQVTPKEALKDQHINTFNDSETLV